ncbi:hypothetical protein SNE25_04490 [Mucilaginibacter sabulilitoris]|uniref:Uncharacterized protein n=1 Tax=Mucilaginibacter sabulilitoris TaxID=1173583 RepID=A0ABZ0TRK1_9SPHI|nr:hypothetical protein [Mucilaginibacter sabulilitoris]WPU94778.1 hypothetical protein SNE25_04490 [Mucilaginibacter sabulilitoris]
MTSLGTEQINEPHVNPAVDEQLSLDLKNDSQTAFTRRVAWNSAVPCRSDNILKQPSSKQARNSEKMSGITNYQDTI